MKYEVCLFDKDNFVLFDKWEFESKEEALEFIRVDLCGCMFESKYCWDSLAGKSYSISLWMI